MRKPKVLKDYIVITKQGEETLQIATSKREVLKAMKLELKDLNSIECLGVYYNYKDPDIVFKEAQAYYRELLKVQALHQKKGHLERLEIVKESIQRLLEQNEYIVSNHRYRAIPQVS